MTRGGTALRWAVRISGPAAVLGCIAITAQVLTGSHVRTWAVVIWAGATALTFGWIIPALDRRARHWEQAAQRWKDSAVAYGRMLDEAHADNFRLLTADRGDQP